MSAIFAGADWEKVIILPSLVRHRQLVYRYHEGERILFWKMLERFIV